MLTVDIQQCANEQQPTAQQLTRWAQLAYLSENANNGNEVEVSLSVLESDAVTKLNAEYRDKAKPTNVLSFPSEPPHPEGFLHLGDIVLCAEVITAEAKEQNKEPESHWAHMVVHGMLHLQGYDHIDNDEALEMEATEIKLLKKLGYNNPYL